MNIYSNKNISQTQTLFPFLHGLASRGLCALVYNVPSNFAAHLFEKANCKILLLTMTLSLLGGLFGTWRAFADAASVVIEYSKTLEPSPVPGPTCSSLCEN